MKVLVHAGLPKTGSSAIQDYLRLHRDEIAAAGASYPKFGANDHWILGGAWSARNGRFHHERRRIRNRSANKIYDDALSSLRALLEQGEAELAILSHESLSNGAKLVAMKEFFASIERPVELHVLAYARPPHDLYSSSLQQSLKNERERRFSPDTWQSPHLGRARAILSNLGGELVLAGFSRAALVEGDVITDFRTRVHRMTGVALPPAVREPRSNASLSAQACAVLQLARMIDAEPIEKRVRQLVRQYDAGAGGTRKLNVPVEWLEVIARNNAAAWNAIATEARFDGGGQDFRLPEDKSSHPPVAEEEVRRWVLAAADPDYLTGLKEQLRERDDIAEKVAAWIDDLQKDLPAAVARAIQRDTDDRRVS